MKKVQLKREYGIANRVMERISVERIHMKSASHFALQKTALALAVSLVVILGIFFVSLLFNRLAIPRVFGMRFALLYFPWFSAALSVSCLFIAFALLEHYKVLYRWSLLRLAGVLILMFLVLGFVVHKTTIHDRLRQSAISGMYFVEGRPLEIFTGHVTEVHTDMSFIFVTIYGTRLRIYKGNDVLLPREKITEDTSLVIAGNREGDMVVARAILSLGERRRLKN